MHQEESENGADLGAADLTVTVLRDHRERPQYAVLHPLAAYDPPSRRSLERFSSEIRAAGRTLRAAASAVVGTRPNRRYR
jgi:hypothetical protein